MDFPSFSPMHLDIIDFCAVECELQLSGERSVSWMIQAYNFATNLEIVCELINDQTAINVPTPDDIRRIGSLVEPVKNANGFRQVSVRVGRDVKMDWHLIPENISDLCSTMTAEIEPGEWFRLYEEIHPFVDGNGRSGAILFNWLNGTLRKPIWPPNFWRDPRRRPGHGA